MEQMACVPKQCTPSKPTSELSELREGFRSMVNHLLSQSHSKQDTLCSADMVHSVFDFSVFIVRRVCTIVLHSDINPSN